MLKLRRICSIRTWAQALISVEKSDVLFTAENEVATMYDLLLRWHVCEIFYAVICVLGLIFIVFGLP